MLYFIVLSTKDLPILRVMNLIKITLSIISIVVPIILIVVSSIELFKLMFKPEESNKTVSKIINKMISAVIIFFIPIGINFVMNMINQDSLDKIEYWTSADDKTIKHLTKLKAKETALRKRAENEKKVAEAQEQSKQYIENLNSLVSYLDGKLTEEEKSEINKIINESKEATKLKLSDKKRESALSLIDELNSYSLPGCEYSLNELKNIIQSENEGTNKDLVDKYLNDINDSLIELDEPNKRAELAYDKLYDDLDLATANLKNINASLKKSLKKVDQLQTKVRKENEKKAQQNNSNNIFGNTVYAASSSQRDQIVAFALQHVGVTPYVYGGTDLKRGADCSGFIMKVYEHFGMNITRTTFTQANAGRKISLSEVRPGDLIFSRNYNHVTMYIGNNQVVQAQCTACGPVKITSIPKDAHDAVTFLND